MWHLTITIAQADRVMILHVLRITACCLQSYHADIQAAINFTLEPIAVCGELPVPSLETRQVLFMGTAY